MRVVDLDRDMSDVIPTGTTRDSQHLFDRMTERTLALARPAPGARVLDVASGFGQDTRALAARGASAVGAEPSSRMLGWARLVDAREREEGRPGPRPRWVQAWGHRLPFADASFDAALCKGALDHFDQPEAAIAEMARVVRPGGRVVLAIANFDSLACRAARGLDVLREDWLAHPARRGRRHYDVPADHFTRYELGLMREQAGRHLVLEQVEGVSLAWGLPGWTRFVEALPPRAARAALQAAGWAARHAPSLADVVLLAGRPRARSASTSR
ncbi:MAG TPA: methyltransferase domain-containing protein [Myxococcota bacterium]|nr:methyltransferase domain-containing protein [Myxococcota bacterium]